MKSENNDDEKYGYWVMIVIIIGIWLGIAGIVTSILAVL